MDQEQNKAQAKGRPEIGTQKHFIRQWRKARGLNIPQLAAKTGYGASLISQIEIGRSRYSQKSLEAIAAVLGVHPGLLLCMDPSSDSWAPFIEARPDEEMAALDEEKKTMLSHSINAHIKFMLDEFAKGTFDKK